MNEQEPSAIGVLHWFQLPDIIIIPRLQAPHRDLFKTTEIIRLDAACSRVSVAVATVLLRPPFAISRPFNPLLAKIRRCPA